MAISTSNLITSLNFCYSAKAKYIITSNVAKIGEKELPLKANIDNALLLIESEPGCNKKEPAIQKPSSEGYVTSDEHLSTEEERPKPHFTVLVSNRYPSAEYSRVPWNENYDFDLEKVITVITLYIIIITYN